MGFAASDIIPKTTEYRLQFQPWASHRSEEQEFEMMAKAAAEARKQVGFPMLDVEYGYFIKKKICWGTI